MYEREMEVSTNFDFVSELENVEAEAAAAEERWHEEDEAAAADEMEEEPTWDGLTADQLEDRAEEKRERSRESWERSDTDGFLSQWASDLSAQLDEMNASALRDGATVSVAVLVDDDDQLVPARTIQTRYGTKWAIFDTFEDANSRVGHIRQWVGLSERALAKKHLRMEWTRVPGHYELKGESYTSTGCRAIPDQLFDADAARKNANW